MLATSIGLMQVMGFNYKIVGFKSVDDMWNFAMESEYNQLIPGLRFIAANNKMLVALQKGDYATFAFFYNGKDYKKFKYDTRMLSAEKRHKLAA